MVVVPTTEGRPPLPDGTDENEDVGPGRAAEDEQVATLRGAGVSVDPARAGRVALALGLGAVIVVAVVLVVAGARKNAQVDSLRAHPVPVDLTVTHCLGLMGGSGSNAAGFECTGTYTYRGHLYTEGVPGSVSYRPGAVVHGVVAASDPGLFSTASTVASEHASPARVLLPAALLAVALGVSGWLLVRRRRRRG